MLRIIVKFIYEAIYRFGICIQLAHSRYNFVSFKVNLIGLQPKGMVSPGAMALAATGSTELAERVTKASATELKMVGINWVYSPVADVNTDSRNPVIGERLHCHPSTIVHDEPIGVRSFGDSKDVDLHC